MSKTPRFDEVLDKYFSDLILDKKGGQWRICRFSSQKFYIRPEDIEFYKEIKVSLPTLTPHERIRRKLAFWNSYNLFKGTSALSGDKLISQYPPNSPYKIYEHQVWFGEGWDPLEYGREYDNNEKFFEQYKALQLKVPRSNLYVDNTSVNSDYTNDSRRLKNCYLIFSGNNSEDCYYGIGVRDSKKCIDSFSLQNCNTCYDCFQSRGLYNCFFVEYSRNCLDSYFLYDCRGCNNCFGGVNLRNKKYYFFNKQLKKEEYESKLKNINLGDREVLDFYKNKFQILKQKAIYKQDHNERAINSLGDYIINSKNCYACFIVNDSQRVAYSLGSLKIRDSYDVSAVDLEFSYEVSGGDKGYRILFSRFIKESQNIEYSELCENCHDCFGCIGLRNKSFCIFNKQYSENEYWEIVDIIKTKMLKNEEYGEFFPPKLSPFPYNISIAMSYKGYDDIEMAKKYGYPVEEVKESLYDVEGEALDAKDVPTDIKEVKDDILSKVIFDRKNNKKFRYVKPELDFHRQHNLPLPLEHYSIRLANKRKQFGTIALELYERTCSKCSKNIQSSYALDRKETIYCEECYLKEVA